MDEGSGEQPRAGRRQLYVGATLVKYESALLDRIFEARAIFRRRGLVAKPERPVDLLDVDAAILDGLKCLGVFHQASGGSLE